MSPPEVAAPREIGDRLAGALLSRLPHQLDRHGTLDVLRHDVEMLG